MDPWSDARSKLGMLLTWRNDKTPPAGFLSGEIEPGESPTDAMVRECKEEAGLLVTAHREIGRRVHPKTGRTMIYVSGAPTGACPPTNGSACPRSAGAGCGQRIVSAPCSTSPRSRACRGWCGGSTSTVRPTSAAPGSAGPRHRRRCRATRCPATRASGMGGSRARPRCFAVGTSRADGAGVPPTGRLDGATMPGGC